VLVLADEMDPQPLEMENAGHEQSELAIAQDQCLRARREVKLFRDLERGGERFDEHRFFVGHALRKRMEVADRHVRKLRERTRGALNTEYGALRAVAGEPGVAPRTATTAEVDFGDHAAPHPLRGAFGDGADELVPWCSPKTEVAAQ
jgi:hypothetical protein